MEDNYISSNDCFKIWLLKPGMLVVSAFDPATRAICQRECYIKLIGAVTCNFVNDNAIKFHFYPSNFLLRLDYSTT